MRKFLAFAVLLTAFSAHAAPASQESIEKLFAVMRTESMLEGMYASVEQSMRQSMKQAVAGKPISAEQQRVLDAMPAKFIVVMRQEFGWQTLLPMYVRIYSETFEQEEIDGLIAFYASPAGQAFVNKMPVVLQKTMGMMQSLMQSFMPKIAAAVEEALAEAKVPR